MHTKIQTNVNKCSLNKIIQKENKVLWTNFLNGCDSRLTKLISNFMHYKKSKCNLFKETQKDLKEKIIAENNKHELLGKIISKKRKNQKELNRQKMEDLLGKNEIK